jgi:CRISPR-associated protein Csb2
MLCATVTWLDRAYEAALDDGAEWPPHPGRLFCALVAASRSDDDDAALRWLEAQTPPEVQFPDAQPARPLVAYVPTNQTGPTKSNRVARTSGTRRWYRTQMESTQAAFTWSAQAAPRVFSALSTLARRVPHLGRSTSACMVSFTQAEAAVAGTSSLGPQARGRERLRVPYPGYLDALRAAFGDGQPSRIANRWAFYGPPAEPAEAPPTVVHGPYPDLLTLGFSPGVQLDGRLVLRVTSAFKAALLSRLGNRHSPDELALLHGHHDGRRRQSAFVALPFVDQHYASGDLLGVGVAVSPDLPRSVRRSLLFEFGFDQDSPRLDHLVVPGLATVPLIQADGRSTVDPQRWSSPSDTWVSALPVVLDRYPDDRDEAARIVALGCAFAGCPDPAEVELLEVAAPRGALRLRGSDLRRKGEPPRPSFNVRVRFATKVAGPVLLGRLRHLGLGLCLPEGTAR